MKAFVTGSTGLLGSNLTRLLLEEGFEVVALTRMLTKARSLLGHHHGLHL
ncbi:MAG: NAD-dependent epimerase/dehydratase family protein, partial [Cyanobacteria bacterium P01_D01_bin.2]